MSLGRDVTLQELREIYDVVVLATGAAKDRALGIDGENLPGVHGSGAFVGWYNSHPDFKDLNPDLNIASAAVIGNGNVAVDVARILAKTAQEMASSDLAAHAASKIHGSPIRDIHILGRRGPIEAAFTPKELGELNALADCVALVDAEELPPIALDENLTGATKKNMSLLRQMALNSEDMKPVRLHIRFFRRPMAIMGDNRVCGIRLEETEVTDGTCKGTGRTEVLPVGLVVPCIGYRSSPLPDVPYDQRRGIYANEDGRIAERLYCVGWCRRGPTGTIGTNKPDGVGVASKILTEVRPSGRPGRKALETIIQERDLNIVTFQDWKKIEAAEISAAVGGAPRAKFADIEEMVAVTDKP